MWYLTHTLGIILSRKWERNILRNGYQNQLPVLARHAGKQIRYKHRTYNRKRDGEAGRTGEGRQTGNFVVSKRHKYKPSIIFTKISLGGKLYTIGQDSCRQFKTDVDKGLVVAPNSLNGVVKRQSLPGKLNQKVCFLNGHAMGNSSQ